MFAINNKINLFLNDLQQKKKKQNQNINLIWALCSQINKISN